MVKCMMISDYKRGRVKREERVDNNRKNEEEGIKREEK